MNDTIIGFFIGLFIGFLTTPVSVWNYADISANHYRAAEVACGIANSVVVSFDRETATCANKAEIPYSIRKEATK